MSGLQDPLQQRVDWAANLLQLQSTGDDMTNGKFDKWFVDFRVSPSLQNEVAQREAENESARKKLAKRDEPKGYENRMKTEATKTAKLRALRLAKETRRAAA